MLKTLWTQLVNVPEGLDWGDRLYVRMLYIMCGLFALNGPLFLLVAFTGHLQALQRLLLVGAAVAVVAAAYALRLFIYWIHLKKLQIISFLHLREEQAPTTH